MAPGSTHKSLFLESKSGKFTIHTTDVPKPGAGEVLIKVQSTSLNPIEWKIHRYGVYVTEYPTVLGGDIAGDVVEAGEGVAGISVGDKVFLQGAFTKTGGGFQQYALARPPLIGKIPNNLTYDDASTLPICLITAYHGFFQNAPHGFGLPNVLVNGLGKSAGQPIVVIGGSSAVGQFAIQLAKLSGFTIIATSSLKHAEYLKILGATHVLDRNTPAEALATDISAVAGGRPLKYVFDAISQPDTQQLGYDLLAPEGELAIVSSDAIKNKVGGKKVQFVRGLAALPANHELASTFFDKVTPFLEEGVIKPLRVDVLPKGLAGIPDGLKRLQNNQVSGVKLVAHPQETE